jgi:hypothetical protein
MQIETDVGAVRNESARRGTLQTLTLKRQQFLEETGNVDNSSRTDQVNTTI